MSCSELEAANFPLTDKFGATLCRFVLDVDQAKKTDAADSLLDCDEAWADWWKHFHKKFQLKN